MDKMFNQDSPIIRGPFQCVNRRIYSPNPPVGTTNNDLHSRIGEDYTTKATDIITETEAATTQSETTPYNACQDNLNVSIDCQEHNQHGCNQSGVYNIGPHGYHGETFQVYCNMSYLAGGHNGTGCKGSGWTVFQRRVNGSVDFYRNWTSYKEGFGQLDHEFWLGNEKLHHLTNQGSFELRIDLVTNQGNPFYFCYENFAIDDETSNYTLNISGWLGEIEDTKMPQLDGIPFTTRDKDNDDAEDFNCAIYRQGAWWYKWNGRKSCIGPNLNGNYTDVGRLKGIIWSSLLKNESNNIQYTEMKIRMKIT